MCEGPVMSEWKQKRFWNNVHVVSSEVGYFIKLDNKILRTPAKKQMMLPTEVLAKKVASEWDEQVEEIDPTTMPFTKSANVALDKVSEQFEEVSSLLGEYGETDLLYYRADSPPELQKRQKTGWDPIVKWAENTFKVHINSGTGIVYIPQNEKLFLETRRKINNLSIFELTAFYDMVSITGSLILGLAIINRRLSAEEAYQLSRIDEQWQLEQWGEDEEAQVASNLKNIAILHSEEFFALSDRNKSTFF